MKRKIFSKLLAGALLVASVSSFVSCKDYDDDINNLQKQIDNAALKSDLSALQTTLTSVQSTANSAATTAQQALTNAGANATDIAALKSTAAQLGTDIAAAAKAAADATTAAQAATEAAEAADAASDAAVAAAAAAAAEAAEEANKEAQAKIDAAIADFTAKFDAVNAAAQAAASQSDVDAAAAAAAAAKKAADDAAALAQAAKDAAAAAATQADIDAAIAKINTVSMDDVNAAIQTAIAAAGQGQGTVQALGWENAINAIEFVIGANNVWNNVDFLNFQYGKELDNVFGKATELHAYQAANEFKTYKKDDDIKAENVYLVRVSPVTADLTKANLKLVNSLGENLDDFVNIKVEAYKDVLTRGGETGLWKLTVTLKEGVKIADLQKATHAIVKNNITTSAAVYAFAANNTAENLADRYAVTAYQLKPLTNKYAPTASLNFNVNTTPVNLIHNRWQGNYVEAEDGTLSRSEDYFELTWIGNDDKGVYVPDTKLIAKGGNDGKTANYGKDGLDIRKNVDCLSVNVGEPIIIDFNAADFMFIDRYYVLFDKDNAIESQPSEWNAWKDLDIDGLAEMKKATERLVITINDEKANGDILGFRLFAVNYDGTLVDPDGKAFYVQVGAPESLDTVLPFGKFNANVATGAGTTVAQAIQNGTNSTMIAYNFRNLGYDNAITLNAAGFPAAVTASRTSNIASAAADINARVVYLKSNTLNEYGDFTPAVKVNEVEYILVTIDNPEDVVNGGVIYTNPVSIVTPDDHNKKVANLQFALEKGTISAPTAWGANLPNWKTGYAPASGSIVTLYPNIDLAGGAWNTTLVGANVPVDLSTYTNNLLTAAPDAVELYIDGSSTKATAAVTAAYYTSATGIFAIPANEVGVTPADGYKYGNHTYRLVLKADATVALSRTWNAGVDKTNAATQTTLAAGQTTIFNYTLKFDNIWDYQTYAVEYTYIGGAVGKAAENKKDNEFYIKYADAIGAAGQVLNAAYVNAVGNPVTTAAYKDYTVSPIWGTAPHVVGCRGTQLGTTLVGTNSAIETFANGNFAEANYVSFTNPVVLTVGNNVENEYLQYVTANPFFGAGAIIAFTRSATAPAVLPAASVKQIFQCTATDAFGKEHKIQIPFTLVP